MGSSPDDDAMNSDAMNQDMLVVDGNTDMEILQPQPVAPRPAAQVIEGGRARLVFSPTVTQVSESGFKIFGMRDDRNVVPWGFWGGAMLVVVAIMVVLFRGSSGIYSMWDLFWVMSAVLVGAVMLKLGRKSSLNKELLCEIDTMRAMMLWPAAPDDPSSTMIAVPFEEITELVFGMTYYPVAENRTDVKVHAFTLLVRDGQERLIPVIEASPNKEETHKLAALIGQLVQKNVTYVGSGIK